MSVDYTLEWVDDGPEPTRTYQVPLIGESITVTVVGRDGRTVFAEALGLQSGGPFSYLWSGRTSPGQFAAPGAYEVRYQTAAGVRLTYPYLLSGTIAATTDSLGRFIVRDLQLPIGFYPVPEYSSTGATYYGNLRVTSEVILGFSVGGIKDFRTVNVRRDQALVFATRLE